MNELINDNRIWFGEDGNNVPRLKRFLSEVNQGIVPLTIWKHLEVGHNQEARTELKELFSQSPLFDTPKPVRLINRVTYISNSKSNSISLDFFSGSGTMAHSIISQNRINNEKKRYILVEMGEYFNTIIIPRLKKVVYSKIWKNGKPESRNSGISHMFKYQTLESYEDSLNNIDFAKPAEIVTELTEYEQQHMFKFETKESNVFLNLDKFKKPFDYTIVVEKDNELMEEAVDLVETFNYLAGIVVYRMYETEHKSIKYRFVEGEQADKNVLVIWRNIAEDFSPEEDRLYLTQHMEQTEKAFDIVYMNGCPTIAEAISIDTEFKEKMWQDGSDA